MQRTSVSVWSRLLCSRAGTSTRMSDHADVCAQLCPWAVTRFLLHLCAWATYQAAKSPKAPPGAESAPGHSPGTVRPTDDGLLSRTVSTLPQCTPMVTCVQSGLSSSCCHCHQCPQSCGFACALCGWTWGCLWAQTDGYGAGGMCRLVVLGSACPTTGAALEVPDGSGGAPCDTRLSHLHSLTHVGLPAVGRLQQHQATKSWSLCPWAFPFAAANSSVAGTTRVSLRLQ